MGIKEKLLRPFRSSAPVERKALDESGRAAAESTQIIDRPVPARPPAQPAGPAPSSPPASERTQVRARPGQEAVAPPPSYDRPAAAAPRPDPAPAAPPPPRPQAPPAGEATIYESAPQRIGTKIAGVLVAIEGPLEGEAFVVRQGKNRIGRRPDDPDGLDDPSENRIALGDADPRISRVHARIFADELLGCEIESLKAENPTHVGDDKIDSRVPLDDNATVAIGRSRFRFRTL